jgi:anti-anti-sigma regulatory factor
MSITSDAEVERGISVSMDGGRIVIRPSGHLDSETLDALLELVAGARSAGATPIVELDQVDALDRLAAVAVLGEECCAAG